MLGSRVGSGVRALMRRCAPGKGNWQGIPIKQPNPEPDQDSWAIWNQQQWQPFPLSPSFPTHMGWEGARLQQNLAVPVEGHRLGHCWSWGTPLGVVVEVLWGSELLEGLGFSAWKAAKQGDSQREQSCIPPCPKGGIALFLAQLWFASAAAGVILRSPVA